MGIRDTRMMARALSERWPIKPEYRAIVVRKLLAIIADPESSNREVTAAIKALISADRNNIEQEKLQQNDDHHGDRIDQQRLARIAEVAKELGFETIARQALEARSAGNFASDDDAEYTDRTANDGT